MGTQQFVTYSRGMSANEAYTRAVEAADDEYGHQQGYSGEINSTAGFRDITDEYERSKKHLRVFMDEKLERATKHDGAMAICVEKPVQNTNKIKSQVDHIVEKGTKKWVLKFIARSRNGNQIARYSTKGEAVKAARAHTEKSGDSTYVEMVKELEKGSTTVAKISYKSSTKEKQGKWVFFGYASC